MTNRALNELTAMEALAGMASGAAWLTLTGETVDAEQARAWGFFQFVAEAQELDALVEQSAAAIVAAGARAVGAQKRLNQHWADADLETALVHSVSREDDDLACCEDARSGHLARRGLRAR